jgi:hypothetical protein
MRLLTRLAMTAGILALASAGGANAATYLLQYSNAFGTGNFGTVDVTGSSTDLHFVVALNGDKIIDTGSHYAVSMDLGGSGFTLVGLSPSQFTLSSGTLSNAPFTGFNLALNCVACGPGGSAPWGHSLTFDITGTNLSVKTANAYNGHPINFAVDALGAGSSTGTVAGGLSASVPEPAAWALMIVGFGGIGAALRVRRRAFAAA